MLSKEAAGQFIDFTVRTSLSAPEVRDRMLGDGWREDAEGGQLTRGSRLWTRLWGAHLAPTRRWPMLADVRATESRTDVRVRDSFGRMWSWSVPDGEGKVAGGAAGRRASGVDRAIAGARQVEKELDDLFSR